MAMTKRTSCALVLLCSLGASGCASILSSGPDKVRFTSNPPGASVKVDDKVLGKTPMEGEVDRSARLVVFILGEEEVTVAIDRSLNLWTIGNAAFGAAGVLGIAIDLALHNHMVAPDTINAVFVGAKGARHFDAAASPGSDDPFDPLK